MSQYGLIGFPLSHSFSPAYFERKFAGLGIEADYRCFPIIRIEDLPTLIETYTGLKGLNVTIPYKQDVVHYMDELSPEASAIGAVNCVEFRGGLLVGHNTDCIGFRRSLLEFLGDERPAALVLGDGGASKAVQYVLSVLEMPFRLVSREREENMRYADLDAGILEAHRLLINCTPLGMYPHPESKPAIPYEFIGSGHRAFDLVYRPAETAFMNAFKEAGAKAVNGLDMLRYQADAAWEIWQGSSGTESRS